MNAPRLLAGPLPDNDPVFGRGIAELRTAMAAGNLSAMDLVRAYLARIAAHDQAGPALNAVLALNGQALAEAWGKNSRSGNPFFWSEKELDHGDKLEVLIGSVGGKSKVRFDVNYGEAYQPTDNGVIAIDTAVAIAGQ